MSQYRDAFLNYMMFTDPSQLIAMPSVPEDITQLGHTIKSMFANGYLDRMWIDANTEEVMVSKSS